MEQENHRYEHDEMNRRASEISFTDFVQYIVLAIFNVGFYIIAAIKAQMLASSIAFSSLALLMIPNVIGYAIVCAIMIHRSGLFKGMLEAWIQLGGSEKLEWENFKNDNRLTKMLPLAFIFGIGPPVICVLVFLFGYAPWEYLGNMFYWFVGALIILNIVGVIYPPQYSKKQQTKYKEQLAVV